MWKKQKGYVGNGKKKQWKKKTKGCVGKALLLFPRVLEYFIYYFIIDAC